VKILNLNSSSVHASADKEKDDGGSLAQVRDLYYRRLARRISDEGSLLMEKLPENEEFARFEELAQMIRTAGEVSAVLWAQNAQMRPSKRDIEGEFIFGNDSTSIRAHPCMCLGKSNRQYDGRRVQLIIEPALFAAGSENGKNYDQLKIRLPAIGWLSKEDPERTSPSPPPPKEGSDLPNTTKRGANANGDVGGDLERPSKRSKHAQVSEGFPLVDSARQTHEEQRDTRTSAEHTEGASTLAPWKGDKEVEQRETAISNFPSNDSMSLNEDFTFVSGNTNADPASGEEDEALNTPDPTIASPKSPLSTDCQVRAPQDAQDAGFATDDRDREVRALGRLEVVRAQESSKGTKNKEGTLEVSHADFPALGDMRRVLATRQHLVDIG
jgi:hypothetical protein